MVADLRVLTARPTAEEEAMAEHALYGVLPAMTPTSVARWLTLVEPVIRRAWEEGKLPLLVGGTGMYVHSLMQGLAEVPEIPPEIRARIRGLSEWSSGERSGGGLGAMPPSEAITLHAQLVTRDPRMAALLKPGDTQRILRALEVMEATGKSLLDWQAARTAPLFPDAPFACYVTDLPRAEIYRRIDARFITMMEQGALEEVRRLLDAHGLLETHWDPKAFPPVFRAHGVPELAAYLRGDMTLNDAIAKAQQNTRNYAKRQLTWIRNQLPQATKIG